MSEAIENKHVTMMIGKFPNVMEMLLSFFVEAIIVTILGTNKERCLIFLCSKELS